MLSERDIAGRWRNFPRRRRKNNFQSCRHPNVSD